MRQTGTKNKTIHWEVLERDKRGKIINISGFKTASDVARFLNVKNQFIYDFTSPRKKYTLTSAYTNKKGKKIKRKGKYADLFQKYSIRRL